MPEAAKTAFAFSLPAAMALEDVFVEHQIDVADLQRPSVI